MKIEQLSTGLNDLAKKVHGLNVAKGFYDEQPSKDRQIMLVVSELSEAYESVRKGRKAHKDFVEVTTESSSCMKEDFELFVKDTEEDEIADAVIRLLDYCGNRGINLDAHINLKLAYNQLRPYKHGKNF